MKAKAGVDAECGWATSAGVRVDQAQRGVRDVDRCSVETRPRSLRTHAKRAETCASSLRERR